MEDTGDCTRGISFGPTAVSAAPCNGAVDSLQIAPAGQTGGGNLRTPWD